MGTYTAFIDTFALDALPQVGGKAAGLGELTRAGFRVPPGFSILIRAFDDFLEVHHLHDTIARMTADIDYGDFNDIEAKTAQLRKYVTGFPIPEPIADEIRESYDTLVRDDSDALVAVRSSVGTRDLSRSSFPGQMDTYHNVRGADEVLRLVRDCWASIWSARAAGTMHALGIDFRNMIIAPLVQRMVPSETAGVLFTVNPGNGYADEVMINAAYGLGEAVVCGKLTPDQYVVSKNDRRITGTRIGDKKFRYDMDPGTGCGRVQVPLDKETAGRPCLNEEQVVELCDAGIRIEAHYGIPQDVEWAFAGGVLHILQSRKIAGLDRIRAAMADDGWVSEFDTPIVDPPDTFTSANISEVLPCVLTPLTLSTLKNLDYGFWRPNRWLGITDKPFPEAENVYVFLGTFYGRAHLNLTAFKAMADRLPGVNVDEIERGIGGESAPRKPIRVSEIVRNLPFLIMLLFKGMVMRFAVPRMLAVKTRKERERFRESRHVDLSRLSLTDLGRLIDSNTRYGRQLMTLHIVNSQMAVVAYELMRTCTRKWMGDLCGAFASRLVTGLANLESAKPGFRIFDLYRLASASAELRRIFADHPPEKIAAVLEETDAPEVTAFRKALRDFLEEYGYRSVMEAELMLPSWEHDPSFVFAMIRNYLNAPHIEDPVLKEIRQQNDRGQAMEEIRRNLGFVKRFILNRVIHEAHTFVPGRENNKAILMMVVHESKQVYREIARRLAGEKRLEQMDDVYFLTKDEIVRLCNGERFDPGDRIARRRAEYARNQTATLPDQFTGHPRPVSRGDEAFVSGDVLKGLPVSPGRVTGRARVILDPRKDPHIEHGEILVAPVTDASWTPLFLMAGALVVDVGGLLSHGSVVAREYGIPGVLNVQNGTKIIRTGQMITVDGTRGEVYLKADSFL